MLARPNPASPEVTAATNTTTTAELTVDAEVVKLCNNIKNTNADGKVDNWEYWENGQVDRYGEDVDGDGAVDKWTRGHPSE